MSQGGVYRYWRDGVLQDIAEPWQLESSADGSVLRGSRVIAGRTAFEVEAHYAGSACLRLHLHWQTGPLARFAQYELLGDELRWRLDEERTIRTLVVPAHSLLFPLLRAASAPLLPLLAEAPRTVIVPAIHDSAQSGFLHPLLSRRHATAQGSHYRYYGGEYGEAGADYWLDAGGAVVRYCWRSAQNEWEVRLESCAAEPVSR